MSDDEFYALLLDVEAGKEIASDKRQQVNEKLDTPMCCDGYMCGCRAASFRDEYEHYFQKRDPAGFQRYVENGRVI